ncbi:MAG: UPF0182 family protein [Firmicutes bacterium]|nr:UPF0182 family protein [Bacillota bacterium]
MKTNKAKLIIALLIAAIFLIFGLSKSLVILFTDWLWFKSVGYASVFTSILSLQVTIGLIAGFAFFIFLYINLLIAKKLAPSFTYWRGSPDDPLYNLLKFLKSPTLKKFFNLIMLAIAAVFAFFVGLSASTNWEVVLRYLNQVPFGIKDPIFGQDVAFHVFSIPFYGAILNIGYSAIILTIILTALVHWINGNISLRPGARTFAPHAKAHLSVLFGLFFVLLAATLKLNSYDLLLSSVGVVFGAGYTDIHAKLPALTILIFSSLVTAILFLVNIHHRGWKLPAIGVVFIIAVYILTIGIYPALVQQYLVAPNEIEKETPYIKQAIKFTNQAYGLNQVKEKPFSSEQVLDKVAIDRNKQVIDNIRLWDWMPLGKTYKQIQSIRLYYDFGDVDIDRYLIDGNYRQVAISARELDTENLPDNAKTWVNQHLVYTHGYGIVANRVNEFTDEGLPKLIVKDIPPKSDTEVLKVTRPEIYFGEKTNDFIIVDTKTREFDYPLGNENSYTKYRGNDGLVLDSLLKKAAFAWRFDSIQLLLSGSLTDSSKILFNRNITERASLIAPFLQYESDPYIVIDKGRLYWIIDAYTTDSRYPYSQPFDETTKSNYIRNSVKVVVDAYNGDTSFYLFDKKDPIIQTYKKAFPKLFKDSSEMPAGLMSHIRYPEELFMVQSQMFAIFHMTDPQVFYNKEDLWTISNEMIEGKQTEIEPYYMVMRLPGESKEAYMIMAPFTPNKKNNMIAWMAAKCDPRDYGKMLVYKFPKQKLVYGPMQIEARINQTPDISQELTLWNQQGSRVIRGNLFVIPIEDSILYVEPLYLQAEQTELPELKRVIVSYGSKVIMADDLTKALDAIFGQSETQAKSSEKTTLVGSTPVTLIDLINQAQQAFDSAQKKQRDGDWAGYGDELKKLEKALADLKDKASKQ